MNNLCIDAGYLSVNKYKEQLCGDHVDMIEQGENSLIMVLADGLGSGVKASILSTLTSKIISTMMANNMSIEDCVATVASTLPVCEKRGIAYSTFTILHIIDSSIVELIQYDNPRVIMLRDGKNYEYDYIEMNIGGKKILKSKVKLKRNDSLIAMSDGAIYAGVGQALNFGWQRENIIDYAEAVYDEKSTAKVLSTLILEECVRLYGNTPGDDTTIAAIRIRKREAVNLIIGPPANPQDANKMMALFFAKDGKHIVCGGTTSSIAANYLGKPLITSLDYIDSEIPPTSKLEGVDLVTEGVITINRVLEFAKSYLSDNECYNEWSIKGDGASLIAHLLFEEATDINFYVGRAINPAHQNPNLPINFSIKMHLIEELSECLKKMGKRINVSYF